MKSRIKIIFGVLSFILFCNTLISQVTYRYTLDTTNIHLTPLPNPIGGIHPPTNYNNINKPLAAEAFATNIQIGVEGGSIHADASGVDDVFYGGDFPITEGHGASAVPIFTKQVFDQSDFPIYLEAHFYSEENNRDYNESYLLIMPENYQYFGSPTYYYSSNAIPAEGILIGAFPFETRILNQRSANQSGTRIATASHNITTNKTWYKLEAVLDIVNGSLIVRDVKIDDQCVFDDFVSIGSMLWLNNSRVGLAVDDLANDFVIKTKYNSLIADFTASDTIICVNECLDFTDLSSTKICNPANSYQWTFDGADVNSSTAINPSNICFSSVGTYPVTLIVRNNFERDTIVKNIRVLPSPTVNLGNDTIICNNSPLSLDATSFNASYLWSDNSTNATLSVNASGQYWVEVSVGNCTAEDTIQVISIEAPAVNLGNDTLICTGNAIELDATQADVNNYTWQDNSTGPTFTASQAGSYFVTASNDCGSSTDSIDIEVLNSTLSLALGNDTTLCPGEIVTLDATQQDVTNYVWQDGSSNSTYFINRSGIYFVEISNSCEMISDTIEVTYLELSLNLGNDTIAICENSLYTLDAYHPTAINYLWQDGSTSSTFETSISGTYYVQISNACEVLQDTVQIIVSEPQLSLELGGNQNICEGDTIVLDATTENGIWYYWQDSVNTPIYTVTTPGEYQVTVQSGCGETTDNITITSENCCNLYIPNAFTPNDDGENDIFRVYQPLKGCNNITNFSMKVFDRWGEMVYQSDNIDEGWNGVWRGQKMGNGVYVFMIEYHDGVNDYLEKGDVTIIR